MRDVMNHIVTSDEICGGGGGGGVAQSENHLSRQDYYFSLLLLLLLGCETLLLPGCETPDCKQASGPRHRSAPTSLPPSTVPTRSSLVDCIIMIL